MKKIQRAPSNDIIIQRRWFKLLNRHGLPSGCCDVGRVRTYVEAHFQLLHHLLHLSISLCSFVAESCCFIVRSWKKSQMLSEIPAEIWSSENGLCQLLWALNKHYSVHVTMQNLTAQNDGHVHDWYLLFLVDMVLYSDEIRLFA